MISGIIIETQSVSFSDESSKTVNLSGGFVRVPNVTVIASDETDSNYNFFIDVVTRGSVTVGVSQNYTGTVNIHAIGY